MSSSPANQRVVYVHRTRGGGVEGVHIEGICGGLRRRGFKISMVAPSRPRDLAPASGAPGMRQRLFDWLSEHAPELLFECAELAYNVVARRMLQREFSAGPVSLIYERYAIFAVAASGRARRAGVPHVLEVNYTAKLPLVRGRSRLLKPLAIAFERRIFRRAALLLAVSSAVREHLIKDYRVSADRIVVTPNAADPSRFDPLTPAVAAVAGMSLAGRQVIGFVGSFAPWHGVELLVKAFAALAREWPNGVLLLVGDGPERARIAGQAAAAGLGQRVLFAGAVLHDELPRYVARFDIAVLPDTNDYGSPMKIFEYFAMARAVVAPDCGPVRDVLQDGVNGLMFRKGDADALSQRLRELLLDASVARRIGAAARATIVQQRNWQSNVDAMLQALKLPVTAPARMAHA